MPTIIISNRKVQIPFDPQVIANLMFQGHTILPDEGVDPKQQEIENQQIGKHLEGLWGNTQRRTTNDHISTGSNRSPGISDGEHFGSGFLPPSGTANEFDMKRMRINPYIKMPIGEFKGYYEPPKTTEAKRKTGLLDDYMNG
jgi:hypothetical protein